jgi:Xaa-Pro dipeptidase
MRERVLELIERNGLGAVVLRRPENFAWYTRGGNSRVEYAAPEGVADVVVTPDADWVLTSTIEAPRMRAEEARGLEVVEYPWEQGPATTLRELVGDVRLGADIALGGSPRCYASGDGEADAGTVDLRDHLSALRRVLDAEAIARLRGIGADLTGALSETAGRLEPGRTEHEAAGELTRACRARGLVPTVLLAATHERIVRHRHPLPTGAPLERRAMIVASAQRGGLYANLTRIVWFEEPDREIARRQDACDGILARMRDEATRPGRSLAEAFEDLGRFYAEAGFPGEWRRHHQGGITGYASREVIATPHTDVEIEPGMGFAWNPSITGAKAEETFVLTTAGAELVTGSSVPA